MMTKKRAAKKKRAKKTAASTRRAAAARRAASKAANARHRANAAFIVAEMLLHIGRGQGAAAAGKAGDETYFQALGNNAFQVIDAKDLALSYERFLRATTASLAAGRLDMRTWHGANPVRKNVLRCCVHMGHIAQNLAVKANAHFVGDPPMTDTELLKAMEDAREQHCPPGEVPNQAGRGFVCP